MSIKLMLINHTNFENVYMSVNQKCDNGFSNANIYNYNSCHVCSGKWHANTGFNQYTTKDSHLNRYIYAWMEIH